MGEYASGSGDGLAPRPVKHVVTVRILIDTTQRGPYPHCGGVPLRGESGTFTTMSKQLTHGGRRRVSARRKRPDGRRGRSDDAGFAGFVLVCDVINFSARDTGDQVAIVKRLWNATRSHPLYRRRARQIHVNGTGDGLLIAFMTNRLVPHEDVLGFADDLMKALSRMRPPAGLRVAVHHGVFQSVAVHQDRRDPDHSQVVGTTINEAQRLCGFADAGEIVVSEQFVSTWVPRVQLRAQRVMRTMFPPREEPPLEVYVKHNVTLSIRWVLSSRSDAIPARVGMLQTIEHRLMQFLEGIETALWKSLSRIDKSLTREALSARVTILAPQAIRGTLKLVSTGVRFHFRGEDTSAGSTKYALSGDGFGPPGRAFVSRGIVVRHKLPDYHAGPRQAKAYVERLNQEFSLDEATVRNFRRKARSFLVFPFGLIDFKDCEPDGVVCVDCRASLKRFSIGKLRSAMQGIQRGNSLHLSTLWRLRLSL